MSVTGVSMRAGYGVQLHPRYSLAGAVLGTALVCAFLLWAFSYSSPLKVASGFVELHLTALPAVPSPRVVRTVSRQTHPLRRSAVTRPALPQPVTIPKIPALPLATSPAPLDLSLPGSVFAPPAASAFVPHAFNPYSDLSHALNMPPPTSTMQNGDAYRSVYGFPVVESGGRCLALQTIQVGPSPTAHATVAFGVSCPGEYKPTMADELKAWAAKRKVKLSNPPY